MVSANLSEMWRKAHSLASLLFAVSAMSDPTLACARCHHPVLEGMRVKCHYCLKLVCARCRSERDRITACIECAFEFREQREGVGT